MIENKSGIYCIENLINGKKYIGQADNLKRRQNAHKNSLNINKSKCVVLQNAWNKYGEENFIFKILLYCEKFFLSEYEIFFIKNMKSHISENGYNISWGGNASFKNRHHSDYSKQLLREQRLGKLMSEEAKQKDRESNLGDKNGFYGKIHSDETKFKMSKNHANFNGENNPAWKTYYNQGKKIKKNTTSKYVGVNKRNNKWRSRIHYKNKEIYLGYFFTEIEAAIAYNKKAVELFGENAKLNIIIEGD
jgi:group I intron endonuclease